jgi:hypothetical protein
VLSTRLNEKLGDVLKGGTVREVRGCGIPVEDSGFLLESRGILEFEFGFEWWK